MIRRPPRSTLFPYTTLSMVAVSLDRKSTRLNSSHTLISYAVFCLKQQHSAARPAHPRPLGRDAAPPRLRDGWHDPFFFNDTATTDIFPLPLHDALPIKNCAAVCPGGAPRCGAKLRQPHRRATRSGRSEEHTSELQSHSHLVCRLLL